MTGLVDRVEVSQLTPLGAQLLAEYDRNHMTLSQEEFQVKAHEWMMAHRGAHRACGRCQGFGTQMYGSGSTYLGGIAGAVCTMDLCSKCWGSGDESRPFRNVKACFLKPRK